MQDYAGGGDRSRKLPQMLQGVQGVLESSFCLHRTKLLSDAAPGNKSKWSRGQEHFLDSLSLSC